MTSYRVVWQIEIDAESPLDAARRALHMQRLTDSTATVFTVSTATAPGASAHYIDLDEHRE